MRVPTNDDIIDVSDGLEPLPVLVAKDVVSSSPASFPRDFQYVTSNVQSLSSSFDASRQRSKRRRSEDGDTTRGCDCPPGRSCDPITCRCCRNSEGFPIYRNRLLQRSICAEASRDGTPTSEEEGGGFFFECGSKCGCSAECVNRQSQRGVEIPLSLRLVASSGAGVGVFTDADLAEGTLVCSYLGEDLCAEEAAERLRRNDDEGDSNYILVTRQHSWQHSRAQLAGDEEGNDGSTGGEGVRVAVRAVDPTRRGNVGRWLNHSCDGGNLAPWMVLVPAAGDAGACRVVFFTTRRVRAGEELRWKYGESGGGDPQPRDEREGRGVERRGRGRGEEEEQEEEDKRGNEAEGKDEGEAGSTELNADKEVEGRGGAGGGAGVEEKTKGGASTTKKNRKGRRRCACATDACRGWMPFDDAALLKTEA